ncbi:MAG TPA: CBS domain-containing protein [Thermoplasmata archaeon]|nr:CBS domain-containing protein [Thermoplasmata archaeon]
MERRGKRVSTKRAAAPKRRPASRHRPAPSRKGRPRPRSPARPTPVEIPLAYNVTVADVMSRSPVTIGTGATLAEALSLLRTNDVSGLPVVDADGNVLGVVSQKDLARRLAVPVDLKNAKGLLDVLMVGLGDQPITQLARLRAELETAHVSDAMASPPFVVRSDAPLELAMRVMSENAISRLPVVDGRKLVGIVTPTDLIAAALRSGRTRS